MDRIEINRDEHTHVRFYTDRGAFDVSLSEFDGGEVLRISTSNGTMTIMPVAANVVFAQVRDPYRDAAMIAGIVERLKE